MAIAFPVQRSPKKSSGDDGNHHKNRLDDDSPRKRLIDSLHRIVRIAVLPGNSMFCTRNISNQRMMERRTDWHDFLPDLSWKSCENDARVHHDLSILARYDNHSLFCGEKEIIYGV